MLIGTECQDLIGEVVSPTVLRSGQQVRRMQTQTPKYYQGGNRQQQAGSHVRWERPAPVPRLDWG